MDAVGNVYGRYMGEPQLRWDVLQGTAIRTRLTLVLHGASGIPAAALVKAIGMNVGKVNFSAELRSGVPAVLEAQTAKHRAEGENLQGLISLREGSVRRFAGRTPGSLSGRRLL